MRPTEHFARHPKPDTQEMIVSLMPSAEQQQQQQRIAYKRNAMPQILRHIERIRLNLCIICIYISIVYDMCVFVYGRARIANLMTP